MKVGAGGKYCVQYDWNVDILELIGGRVKEREVGGLEVR